MLGEDGNKMSKSKRNYREPSEIFDRYGADALRWYFFANQPPWTSIRYNEQAIKDTIPEFLLRLWNVYSFFVIYAGIDGFDPAAGVRGPAGQLTPEALATAADYRPLAERGELDRWILSELNRTAAAVVEQFDAYDNYDACATAHRVCRCLEQLVRPPQPRPFLERPAVGRQDRRPLDAVRVPADDLQADRPAGAISGRGNVAKSGRGGFCRPPGCRAAAGERPPLRLSPGDPAAIDETLSQRMALVREIVSLGRSARMAARLKVRQPLSRVEVILVDAQQQAWLEEHAALICDEFNVKRVEFIPRADQYITYSVLPDLKRLGPRLGKRLPALGN